MKKKKDLPPIFADTSHIKQTLKKITKLLNIITSIFLVKMAKLYQIFKKN